MIFVASVKGKFILITLIRRTENTKFTIPIGFGLIVWFKLIGEKGVFIILRIGKNGSRIQFDKRGV